MQIAPVLVCGHTSKAPSLYEEAMARFGRPSARSAQRAAAVLVLVVPRRTGHSEGRIKMWGSKAWPTGAPGL